MRRCPSVRERFRNIKRLCALAFLEWDCECAGTENQAGTDGCARHMICFRSDGVGAGPSRLRKGCFSIFIADRSGLRADRRGQKGV